MSAIANTKTIMKRELVSYFLSPVAYVFIIIFLMLTGFFTFMLGGFFARSEASMDAFFMWHPWLYLFLVPAVGMRLWAEERRSGSIELLLTMPIAPWHAILGKFFAAWLFLGIALGLTFPMILTVAFLGDPDGGVITSAYLGSFLMAGAYLAISGLTSAMTKNQVISFVTAVVICLFLVLAGFPPITDMFVNFWPWLIDAVAGFSVMTHYEGLQKGVISARDLAYFASIMAFALFATGVVLRNRRAA